MCSGLFDYHTGLRLLVRVLFVLSPCGQIELTPIKMLTPRCLDRFTTVYGNSALKQLSPLIR